jgi:hypothetical protein
MEPHVGTRSTAVQIQSRQNLKTMEPFLPLLGERAGVREIWFG